MNKYQQQADLIEPTQGGIYIVRQKMNRVLIVALALLSCGCTTRLHYDYFEPSGLDSTVSMPPGAPKNVAILAWDGCELQVRAEVSKENLIVVALRSILPPGAHAAFSSKQAILRVAGVEKEMNLSWQEWTLSDGIGARREVAFDARLKPQSFAKTPTRKGIEDMGRYETTLTLPDGYSSVRGFALALPAPVAHPPILLTFLRKTADYRVFVPLQ